MSENKKSKFIPILLVLVIIAIAGWVVGIKTFTTKQPNQNINSDSTKVEKNGFSFSYPDNLDIQFAGSTEDNYANYQITNPAILPENRSGITASIPLKNTSSAFTLADEIKNEADPSKIIKISLNGHQCESVEYRLDTDYPGDIPVHAFRSKIRCATKYETSPFSLDYIKRDTDASLDVAWESIRKSIKY